MKRSIYLALLIAVLSANSALAQYPYSGPGISDPQNQTTLPSPGVQTYPPGIMFSTLLDNVNVIGRDGALRLGNKMQNVFMPEGAIGKAVLSRGNGKEFCHWKWKLDSFGLKPPYKLFGFQQPLAPDGSNIAYDKLKLNEPGEYVFDFFIGEKRMYTFPFSVRKIEPENPFDGNAIFVTDGAWNDWGYMYYANAEPSQGLAWKLWMRDDIVKHPRHEVRIEVVRDKDKKLICQSRENTTYSFRNEWVRYNFDLVNPPVKTSGGAYFKAQDLLAVDGGYTLTMKVDGKLYGVWKFNVEGGKFAYTGQTVRGTADPMTFVEGGKDAFWYKRESK